MSHNHTCLLFRLTVIGESMVYYAMSEKHEFASHQLKDPDHVPYMYEPETVNPDEENQIIVGKDYQEFLNLNQ